MILCDIQGFFPFESHTRSGTASGHQLEIQSVLETDAECLDSLESYENLDKCQSDECIGSSLSLLSNLMPATLIVYSFKPCPGAIFHGKYIARFPPSTVGNAVGNLFLH